MRVLYLPGGCSYEIICRDLLQGTLDDSGRNASFAVCFPFDQLRAGRCREAARSVDFYKLPRRTRSKENVIEPFSPYCSVADCGAENWQSWSSRIFSNARSIGRS